MTALVWRPGPFLERSARLSSICPFRAPRPLVFCLLSLSKAIFCLLSLSKAIFCLLLLSAVLCGHSSAAAATRVRIHGLRDKTEQQLLDLMGGRLYQVRGSPASPSRADDAAFLLRQVMLRDGYTGVEVTWRITGPDEIVLTVAPTSRLMLGKVTVLGVAGRDASRLVRLFRSPAEKDLAADASPPFREEDVATGLSYLEQELQAQGFWEAAAVLENRLPKPTGNSRDCVIRITRGPLYHIAPARIAATASAAAELTRGAATPFSGRPATTANLNAMRSAVEAAFLSRGYPDAKISMGRALASPDFIPEFTAELGSRVRLRHLTADGFQRTNPQRIQRRMQDFEGAWYDKAAMNKRLRELLATGAFASARVETVPRGDNLIDACLHFEETNAREITFAAGAGSYQGPIARFAYADRNLSGQLLGFSTGVELSGRGVLGETRLTDPWLLGSDFAVSARVYALTSTPDGYDSLASGIDGGIGRKFADHYKIDLLAGWALVNNSAHGLPAASLGETVYGHPQLRLTQTLDYRDNPVLPKSGWHLQLPLEAGAAVGNTATGYVKAGLLGGWYQQLNSDYQLALGGQCGLLIPTGDGSGFPIDLRYFNGGARSVRSFPERDLGPSAGTGNYPTGGDAYWTSNLELIRQLPGTLKLVGFLDAGTLSQNYSDIFAADVELAAGLGLRLDLPLGPLRLEYGFNLTRRPGDPTGAFHFAIGTAF